MRTHFKPQTTPAGKVHIRVLLISVLIVIVAIWFVRSSSPARQIEKKQAALLVGIEKRSRSKVEKLIASDYRDRWDFDREDAVTAFLDVGSQFLVLAVDTVDATTEINGGQATVTARLKVAGSGSPVAQLVINRANQLKTPFTFYWEKQSWWPRSWRLVRIENDELPADLDGYEPGDIRKTMSME